MTIPTFEDQLAAVTDKVRSVNMWNDFDRYRDGLLYYWNKAERLRDSANILWTHSWPGNEVALMLAGLSVELLLKGTILGLQVVFLNCHKLDCLIAIAGISVDDRDHQTSRLLSEHVIWAGRYPTPKFAKDWFLEETGGWPLSLVPARHNANEHEEYERLWATLAPYFWRVNDATFESADLNEEDAYRLRERPNLAPHEYISRRI